MSADWKAIRAEVRAMTDEQLEVEAAKPKLKAIRDGEPFTTGCGPQAMAQEAKEELTWRRVQRFEPRQLGGGPTRIPWSPAWKWTTWWCAPPCLPECGSS